MCFIHAMPERWEYLDAKAVHASCAPITLFTQKAKHSIFPPVTASRLSVLLLLCFYFLYSTLCGVFPSPNPLSLPPSPVFSPCHLKCSGLACNHSTASFRSRCLPRDCFRIPEILWGHLSLVYWCDQEALLFPFSLQNCKQFCAFCTLLKRTSVQEPKCQPLAFAPGLKG